MRLCLELPLLLAFVVDLLPLLCCMYVYVEQGPLIANFFSQEDFLDHQLQEIEAKLLNIKIYEGIGVYLRSLTPLTFNRILGEYLHLCYFAFYIVLFGTWLFIWMFCSRNAFDIAATAETSVYLFCLACYLITPAAGPYWTYNHPDPQDAGYLFSRITQMLVDSGSSTGTAFPSSHCAITMVAWMSAIRFLPQLGFLYVFICPGIIFATIWCGFHYAVDSISGVIVGYVVGRLAMRFAERAEYCKPVCDRAYYTSKEDGIDTFQLRHLMV